MISSLKASLTPSASDCSTPHGPTRFGPIRFCIRPTTLRSNTIANSVMTTRNAKTPTTLIRMIQTGWLPKPGRFCERRRARRCAHDSLHSHDRRGIGTGEPHRRARHRAERGPHRAAARVGRQPHDAVGHRRRSRPARRPRRRRCSPRSSRRRATPSFAAVRWPSQRARRLGGAGQVLVAVLHPAGVEQLGPGGQQRLAVARASAGSAPCTRRRRPAADAAGAEPQQLGAGGLRRWAGRGRRRAPRPARGAPGRRDIAPVPVMVSSNGRRRPSQVT